MSLQHIVATLGGELYENGTRAMIPAPNHSKADRSVSLMLNGGRIVANTFGGTSWQAVLDELRKRGLIDASNAPTSISGDMSGYHGVRATNQERSYTAKTLFGRARPIAGTLSERHARLRAIKRPLPDERVLRHAEAAPLKAYDPDYRTKPAVFVAISSSTGELTAIEITYLEADGTRTTKLKLPRKTVGSEPPGSSVLIDPAEPELLVGEGFFTTLSGSERFDLPAHALLSIRNMRSWIPPEGVKSVLIAGDNGRYGQAAAKDLATRLRGAGLKARAEFPPARFDDWNAFGRAQACRAEGGQ